MRDNDGRRLPLAQTSTQSDLAHTHTPARRPRDLCTDVLLLSGTYVANRRRVDPKCEENIINIKQCICSRVYSKKKNTLN